MGAELTQYIQEERATQQFPQRMKYNRFVYMLRQYAREQGMEISKFI